MTATQAVLAVAAVTLGLILYLRRRRLFCRHSWAYSRRHEGYLRCPRCNTLRRDR